MEYKELTYESKYHTEGDTTVRIATTGSELDHLYEETYKKWKAQQILAANQ